MKKIYIKLLTLILTLNLAFGGVSSVGYTKAVFNDKEVSEANMFQATFLDFLVINKEIKGFIGIELGEDYEHLSIVKTVTNSLPIQYSAYAEFLDGNELCQKLWLNARHTTMEYDGGVLGFTTPNLTEFGTWAYTLELPYLDTSIPHGATCDVDLVFEGWRDDVPTFLESGFTDEERVTIRLESRMIVLNEFLARPLDYQYSFDFGTDDSLMPQGEWVEIYNNSIYEFDVAGWSIGDGDGGIIPITALNTYPATTMVSPLGYLVVYMNSALLDNDGDSVKLFDAKSDLVDSYSYLTHDVCEQMPTPGDENTFEIGTEVVCELVPANKSYARIPDGVGDWVDPIPTPGDENTIDKFEGIERLGDFKIAMLQVEEEVVESLDVLSDAVEPQPVVVDESLAVQGVVDVVEPQVEGEVVEDVLDVDVPVEDEVLIEVLDTELFVEPALTEIVETEMSEVVDDEALENEVVTEDIVSEEVEAPEEMTVPEEVVVDVKPVDAIDDIDLVLESDDNGDDDLVVDEEVVIVIDENMEEVPDGTVDSASVEGIEVLAEEGKKELEVASDEPFVEVEEIVEEPVIEDVEVEVVEEVVVEPVVEDMEVVEEPILEGSQPDTLVEVSVEADDVLLNN